MSQTKEAYLRRKEEAGAENCRMYLCAVYGDDWNRSPLLMDLCMVVFSQEQDRPMDESYHMHYGFWYTDARLDVPDINMKTP